MFMEIVEVICWLLLAFAVSLGLLLAYGVTRREPPFKPGTEPKHYWELSRAEKLKQELDSRKAKLVADEVRRRDAWENYGELRGFDPKITYPAAEGAPTVTREEQQHELERINTLITNMIILRASPWEMGRAVRHSMVVIDAQKHQLNYKQSEVDNGIGALEDKYS